MEHIVQFAIGIDDDGIKKRITEPAEKQIIQNIEQAIRDKLFQSSYYGGHANEKSPLSCHSERLLNDFLEKHREEILEKTAVIS